MKKPPPRVLVLTGPTAVGKTELAIQWAQRYDGEIIGADSRQIYRHMDIGTAKPGVEDRARVPHHLIDVVEPHQTLTLSEYQAAANEAILEIDGRGCLPVLVGGTGLYITATLEGWKMPEVPPDPVLRSELENLSNEVLLAKLETLDPVTASTIDARNPRRLVRAVEVCLITGRPFSELRGKEPPGYRTLEVVLSMPREELYTRADRRIDQMIEAGWLEEVRGLLARGYEANLPAMSALGYPQMAAVIMGKMNLDEAREEIRRRTRRFIRRQYTWIRGHGGDSMCWIEPGEHLHEKIGAFLDE